MILCLALFTKEKVEYLGAYVEGLYRNYNSFVCLYIKMLW